MLASDHAPIHDPDTIGLAVTRFHGGHNLFHGGAVEAIAVKNFIADRHPTTGYD